MFVALIVQDAKRMHHIILPSVAYLAAPYFFTLSHIPERLKKKVIEHKMCVFVFSTTFVRKVSHFKKNSE